MKSKDRPMGDVFHPDTREVLLTKEQSSKLDWKPTSGKMRIPANVHYAYRLDYGVEKDKEEDFVAFSNKIHVMFGMATISSLEDTDFACTPVSEELSIESNAIAYAILTEEQVKEIFNV